MYLPHDNYSTRPDTPEQCVVYNYIRNLSTEPPDVAIEAFYRLLWDGNASPDGTVHVAWKKVVSAPDFDRYKLEIINRCFYTLVNPWHLDGGRDRALEQLILSLHDIVPVRALNPTLKKLRDSLQLYRDSDYYSVLRRHLYLLENSTGTFRSEYFGDRFSNYFFIYEAGTQTRDIEREGKKLNAGILDKRNKKLCTYHRNLTEFYVRYERSSTFEKVNDTHLSDHDLYNAINLYKPKRSDSFKQTCDLFRARAHHIKEANEFKNVLRDHVIHPVSKVRPDLKKRFDRDFQKALDTISGDAPLTRLVKIQMFRRILCELIRHDSSKAGGDALFYLVNGIGESMVVSMVLNILLACEMVRFDLEKRFAALYHQFSDYKSESVKWLIQLFDHVNVALALNSKYLGYFKLNNQNSFLIPDSI